jgi:DNA processing protein
MSDRIYQVALSLVDGVGSVLYRQLISHFGDAKMVFEAKNDKLLRISGVGNTIVENFSKRGELFKKAEIILNRAEKENAKIIFFNEDDYPSRLKNLYDAPAILYYKGSTTLNHPRTIGIVGTRKMTDYGKKITEDIVEGLRNHNIQIISGLALGIDGAAHRSALENNLSTIGVMANGVNSVYPPSHVKIAEQMLENGALISENPFDVQPLAQLFLARNRIIAGLSDVVIVVESAKKGGAMVSAEFANNYHREVFAVPGTLANRYSEGCNKLIQQNKALIYTSVQDIIEAMNWDVEDTDNQRVMAKEPQIDLSKFTNEEASVISVLKNGELLIDDLSWQTQIPLNRLASLLLNLEFQGFVKAMPGKKFGLK